MWFISLFPWEQIKKYININISISIIIIIINNLNCINSSHVGWCLSLTLTIPPAQIWARDERCCRKAYKRSKKCNFFDFFANYIH